MGAVRRECWRSLINHEAFSHPNFCHCRRPRVSRFVLLRGKGVSQCIVVSISCIVLATHQARMSAVNVTSSGGFSVYTA